MDDKTEIRAVELVRRIRDQQVRELRGLSRQELIDWYRSAGTEALSRAGRQRQAAETTNS